jgi:hypothetical protein
MHSEPSRLRDHLDELLDEALDESFPASDVPSIAVPEPPQAPGSRQTSPPAAGTPEDTHEQR